MDKKDIISNIEDIVKDLKAQLEWHNQHHSGEHLWSVEHRIEALNHVLSMLTPKAT
jgi:hypothetical protein